MISRTLPPNKIKMRTLRRPAPRHEQRMTTPTPRASRLRINPPKNPWMNRHPMVQARTRTHPKSRADRSSLRSPGPQVHPAHRPRSRPSNTPTNKQMPRMPMRNVVCQRKVRDPGAAFIQPDARRRFRNRQCVGSGLRFARRRSGKAVLEQFEQRQRKSRRFFLAQV